jgi:glycine cleavage system regulatory protein
MTRPTAGWPLRRATVIMLLALTGCSQAPFRGNADISPGAVPQKFAFGGGTSFGALSAIAHRFTLVVPNAEIEAVQEKNSAECVKLGCNILSSSINRSDRGAVSASMLIRIKPDAYDAFAAALAAPPARIRNHSQTADDLAAPVLDAEKRMAAKTALRERLTALLNDQSTKTAADLIAIEKELSEAQSEIENFTAQLENLRKRTDMVSVDITYVGTTAGYGGLDFVPLHEAVMDIGQTVIRSLSWLIYFLAAVGPWLPVIVVVWWAIRRSVRRRRSSRSAVSTPSA